MHLLTGAQLSEPDIEALLGGADLAAIVAERMSQGLDQQIDAISRDRLAALAWMIRHGTLEVRVVLPTASDGRPLAASECHDYFHAKTGIFTDDLGNRVAFAGSINEGEQAWLHNYEMFSVYCSWRAEQNAYIETYQSMFDRLWEGKEKGWLGLPIPEAVQKRLLRHCPKSPPSRDPLEKQPPVAEGGIRPEIVFWFLKDAPFLPNADRLGEEASAVTLWPHQARVVQKVVSTFPERYLLCDEVGLGKTLEGGAIIKQLMLAGRVHRCLILAPKSVCRQWQEELYESFLLNVPEYDGASFRDYFHREWVGSMENPWEAFPVILASSQLVKRRERASQLLSAKPWDLVLVDEAHHARRKDFLSGRYRRNRLLSLLLGAQETPGSRGLADRTRGLLLMTATPMQVDPREVWDLLTVLGLGGRWGASEELFLRFFREVRNGEAADWTFLLSLVRDHLENGGAIEPVLDQVARDRIGPVSWATIRQLPFSSKVWAEIGQLDAEDRAVLLEFIRRTTPLSRYMFRNTRALLRKYQEKGLLGNRRIPTRRPEPVWIPMEPDERELYERIEEYISEFYRKYEEQRAGLGFIMTVYRRRLTSSFRAVEKSLERRLAFLRGDPQESPISGLSYEDYEEDDLSEDALESLGPGIESLAAEEIAYVEDFRRDLHALASDSKAARLLEDLPKLLSKRETILIFTLYTDTMDWLREQLRAVYGGQIACFSGRGGEVWDGQGWRRISKERIKEEFTREKIKILLGTDAMSEGLNLQSCGMMINYDMPWNPMRVEQRIGRIDRIEQRYPEVWIRNYFYEDTVEAKVYRALEGRISWFETVVGTLQPILARVARAIQEAAMSGREARPQRLSAALEELKRRLDEEQVEALDLDSWLGLDEEPPRTDAEIPVTRQDIEKILLGMQTARRLFRSHPQIAGAYLLDLGGQSIPVTFDSEVFAAHPEELRLLAYGEPIFHGMLEKLCPSEEPQLPSWFVRFKSQEPAVCGWWRLDGAEPVPISSLKQLQEALAGSSVEPPASARIAAWHAFQRSIVEIKSKELAIAGLRLKARREALRERGRHLLLQATYLDLALSAAEAPPFGPEAVVNLKRHGFPFTALIALVTVQGIEPSLADPSREEARAASADSLRRRFEETKKRAKELVTEIKSVVRE